MSRNEYISEDEMQAFTAGCCDGSKIRTKTGMRHNRAQVYDDVPIESLTSKFDEYGRKINKDNSRVERSEIAESRFRRSACRKEQLDD